MKPTILVTGATGNVGREVVRTLQQLGQPVIAAVLDEEDAQHVPGEDTPTVRFDFTDPNTYTAALQDVQKLFLLRPPAIADVEHTLHPVVEHARAAGVTHIVFLSLMGVSHNRRVPHYKVEKKIEASGVPYTFLRPSFYMQNLDTFYRDDIGYRNEIFLPAGKGKTSFIDVRDIGAVAAKVFTEAGHQNRAYTLTGGEALDYFQVAEIFTEVLDRTITYAKPSPRQYKKRMRALGIEEQFIEVMLGLYFTVRMGFGAQVTGDVPQLLGRPAITMRRYVEDYAHKWQLPEAALT